MGRKQLSEEARTWIWSIIGTLMLVSVPAIIVITPYSHNLITWIGDNVNNIIGAIMNAISVLVCGYCLTRTILGIVGNRFLPRIPMPRNKALRLILMTSIGIVIGLVSTVTTLILWVVTCILGMMTYSFVETHDTQRAV